MAHDVFISYAEEDRAVADAVCRALEEAGVQCWYAPRDVPYAVDYEEAIVDAISESQLLVLILSTHSNTSAHVKREMQNACREEPPVPVLPFQVENITLNKSLRYYIGSIQWMSALTPPLETHLQKLVTYVRSRLPRHEEGKGLTEQHAQQAEPQASTGVNEEERGRAKEGGPMPKAADVVAQCVTERRFPALVRWFEKKPTRMLFFALLLGIFIYLFTFLFKKPQTANQNPTPTSTQQSDQKIDAPETAAENAKRGDELFRQGKYPEAELYYRQAAYLEPRNASYFNALGDSLARQWYYAEAKIVYREAVRLKPNEERYHFNLGWVLKEQREYAEAEQAYREAMRINPADGTIRNYLGDVLYLQSKFAEAETQYREALRISPDNAAFHYSLGNALFAQRKNAEAKLQYQTAAQLDPLNTSYQEALERVR